MESSKRRTIRIQYTSHFREYFNRLNVSNNNTKADKEGHVVNSTGYGVF